MRSEGEIADFEVEARRRIIMPCKVCDGMGPKGCECVVRHKHEVRCYTACLPRGFWDVKDEDVTHNTEVFQTVIQRYGRKLGTACREGYGLVLSGANGVGKTMFLSYILTRVLKKGLTAYYTSALQLDHNVRRGFSDREAAERLRIMLTVDFLAIDELGKEKHKEGDSFMRKELERILKERYDDNAPVLLATNMAATDFKNEYGQTLASIITGKYETVTMKPGDFRAELRKKMKKEMGYR